MMTTKKVLHYLDRITQIIEIIIALSLLIVIAIRVVEIFADMLGFQLIVLTVGIESILSTAFTLVIGVEFTKMLYKHTPETVIDVLLFAIARQTVIYYDRTIDMMIGVVSIAGLFAAKRYLIDWKEPTL